MHEVYHVAPFAPTATLQKAADLAADGKLKIAIGRTVELNELGFVFHPNLHLSVTTDLADLADLINVPCALQSDEVNLRYSGYASAIDVSAP